MNSVFHPHRALVSLCRLMEARAPLVREQAAWVCRQMEEQVSLAVEEVSSAAVLVRLLVAV